jgi:hypothetical protein
MNRASHSADAINAALFERYLDVLLRHPLRKIAQSEEPGILSGVFLPVADDAYLQSKVRVMLVGQEPKSWGAGLHTLAEGFSPTALRAYVHSQMEAYRKFAPTSSGRSRFRQFHDRLHARLAVHVGPVRNAILWSNLLCMSRKRASPRAALEIERIAALSRALLDVQFEILQPQLVVFTTGSGYDLFLKQQIGEYDTLPGLKPKQYWPFIARHPQFQAWRVRHPRRLTRDIRNELLDSISAVAHLRAQEQTADRRAGAD